MPSLSLAQGGRRPIDLPPTLQPNAIAAMAPPTDKRLTTALSVLTYGMLGGAIVLLSAVKAGVIKTELITGPPIVLNEPATEVHPVVASLTTTPAPAQAREGDHALAKESEVPPAAARNESVPDTPQHVQGVDQSQSGATGGKITGTGQVGVIGGSKDPGAPPNGTVNGTGHYPSSTPIEVSATQVHILSTVQPSYPALAKLAHIQGAVVLMMTIDAQGVPTDVQVLSGPAQLHAEAVRAARLWRFEAARVSGQAVPAMFRLTIQFSLK